jgi:hypothetical protein
VVVRQQLRKAVFRFAALSPVWRDSDIDVALPYYPGMEPPFVCATIRRLLVLPNNSFHYGAKSPPLTRFGNPNRALSTRLGGNYIPIAEYAILS